MSGIWSAEYWAKKGDVDLYMYRKCREQPVKGKNPPVLFLVHGSSFSSRPGYDMVVPGRIDYSQMDECAKMGFDVWTMDHECYGRSSRTAGNSDIATGAEDLKAATVVLERETGLKKYAFYGQSSGALRAALFAQLNPDKVERLVLDAFVWTGKGSVTLAKRREGLAAYRGSNMRPVNRDTYRQSLTRDAPGVRTCEEEVIQALADAALKDGDSVPTGSFMDMCTKLPLVDPRKITCPVFIMRGDHDAISTHEDILDFYRELPNTDKHFSMMAH
ncbi:MAG: alpha/beta fold hydrolase [Sulfuricaulis sp.]|nr:alpha/beta fold hydrolase [Sulfuricaulis sp.]